MQPWEDMSEGEFRGYVSRRMDELDKRMDDTLDHINAKLDRVLNLLELGKLGGAVLKWTVGIGAAVAVIWGTWFHKGP